jgi:hypothetical protein
MYPLAPLPKALIVGQPAVESVGITPTVASVPAKVPTPGVPACANGEVILKPTAVMLAIFFWTTSCLLDAI